MRRGEVWWAVMPAPAGRRPVLLLSRDTAYRVRSSVTVAPLTRTARGLAVEVLLTRADGVPVDSVVNLDDVTTIPKQLLRDYITSLSDGKMCQVVAAIDFALDLEANR